MFLAMEFLRKCPEWGWLNTEAIEPTKEQVGRAIGQLAGLDRVQVIDQEQEDVAVGRIERRRVLGDVDIGVVDPGRPVEHAGHLPARIAGTIARDALDSLGKFMVVDAAVIGAGDGAQVDAAVVGFQRLDLLGPVGREAVLQVDPRQRGGKLPQVRRGRPDHAGQLAEGPMRGCHGRLGTGQHQRQPLGVVAARLHLDRGALDDARAAARGTGAHGLGQFGEREVALVIGAREPFRRHAPHTFAPPDIDLVAARHIAPSFENLTLDHG